MTTTAGRRPAVDTQAADAIDLARSALDGLADPVSVGEHVGVEADDDRVVTHLFECLTPGYRGWRWAVTVARASRSRQVTVDEAVLLPGPDSLVAPEWLPWSDRLRPGDLGVGDLLPTREDDERLEPGWNAAPAAASAAAPPDEASADEGGDGSAAEVAAVLLELDLARPRVLSPIGLDDAIDRWLAGDDGPTSAMSQAAPASCATCGFRIAVGGRLGRAFGVCANEISPSDGHVVSLDHGCGAHSEAAVLPAAHALAPPVIDELGFDVLSDGEVPAEPSAPVDHDPGTVLDEDPVEDMGHS
ncbi:MAG TPA: DUF3027 domain-containing protein [Actinomycetes bacterium]|nr:DUF3027 domain-containing protein [Actinomycetes bacterium]